MDSLYDLNIDLSSNDGGIERSRFKDWMRVRLFGNTKPRKLYVPTIVGSVYFYNDGDDDVSIRRGAAIPVALSRGECIHLMFDGSADGMLKVG